MPPSANPTATSCPNSGAELEKLRRIHAARRAAEAPPPPPPPPADPTTEDFHIPTALINDLETPNVQVPGYSILREISRGGQAAVYLATQLSTGRKIALKIMHDGPFASDRAITRFRREVQALAALNHPNIVTIIDTGKTPDGTRFIAMNYIAGMNLSDFMKDRHKKDPTDPAKLLRLFLKICDAVNAAHRLGIIHRDLKPSNIRVDERGEPHILDFGLARTALDHALPNPDHAVSVTGEFLGSLPWSSPEQAEGNPEKIDIRTDVYSLGVILYQILTNGRFPYEVVGNIRDILNNILTVDPTPPKAKFSPHPSPTNPKTPSLRAPFPPSTKPSKKSSSKRSPRNPRTATAPPETLAATSPATSPATAPPRAHPLPSSARHTPTNFRACSKPSSSPSPSSHSLARQSFFSLILPPAPPPPHPRHTRATLPRLPRLSPTTPLAIDHPTHPENTVRVSSPPAIPFTSHGTLAILFKGGTLDLFLNGQRIHQSTGDDLRSIPLTLAPGDRIVLRLQSSFYYRSVRCAFVADNPAASFIEKAADAMIRPTPDPATPPHPLPHPSPLPPPPPVRTMTASKPSGPTPPSPLPPNGSPSPNPTLPTTSPSLFPRFRIDTFFVYSSLHFWRFLCNLFLDHGRSPSSWR